eukprot:gene4143-5897_t
MSENSYQKFTDEVAAEIVASGDGYMDHISLETYLVSYNPCENDPHGATSMPIYQTATFKQMGASDFGEYDYTRSGNPTRTALQNQIAKLEGTEHAKSFCYSTGMAAIASVIHLVQAGEEIIINDDCYGGTYRITSKVATRQGISIKYLNMAGSEGLERLRNSITSKTRMVIIESPTNPLLRICNIRELSSICHSNNNSLGTLLVIDNTMMSPILCRPLELGADIVIHSATKFMSGHSDTMAGVATVVDRREGEKSLSEALYFYQNAEGSALSPFDCWLVLRGIKTMALRVYKQQENALIIAKWLSSHEKVTKVYYAGLDDHTDYDLHMTQATGGGSIVCFLTGNLALSSHIVTVTKLFKITVSFGTVSSLISVPGNMSHASIPEEERMFPQDLVRMSIGIESPQDLINDLSWAISSFKAV